MNVTQKNHRAFTLTELIVVVTILAILWTLGFISFNGYSRDARNSYRISDMKIIDKALWLHITTQWALPLPDDRISITYSWWLAWTQWVFWESSRLQTQRVSNVPLDPSFDIPYSYSVTSSRTKYQTSVALEWPNLFWAQQLIWQVHAITNEDFSSYNLWNYIDRDIVVTSGSGCYIITTPSIILSDIPTWWLLENNTPYNYTYNKSSHVSNAYSWAISNTHSAPGFQNREVFSGCSITNLNELELYNAQLSTAYQQFAGDIAFEQLIFNSNSNDFMLKGARSLEERWIVINESVIDELVSPTPLQTFSDSFTTVNGTNLVWAHTPDDIWIWLNVPWWDVNSYQISANTLVKQDASTSKIYPRPNPNILSSNYSVTLDIVDFGGGAISLYLRYIDNNNYYRVELRSDGYTIYRNISGTEVPTSDILEAIAPWSEVIFEVDGDSVGLTIAWDPKWSSIIWWVDGRWNPVLWLENTWAAIDNYSLNYK